MIDWVASKILISFYKTKFFLIYRVPLQILKKFVKKSWNLAFLRVLWALKQCKKFQNFGLSTKKYWDSKMHRSCLTPLVLLIFKLSGKLWGAITFELVISLCWNLQDNLMSYITFIWKSFIKIWDSSCSALVHLTWNDPS